MAIPDPVNPFESLVRFFILIFLGFMTFFGMSSSGGGDMNAAPPAPGTGGAQASGSEVLTVVENVEALVRESFPPQVSLHITGYQPDGCTFPVQVEQTRDGSAISVKIYRVLPPDIMCTMQLVIYDETITLDGPFDSGEYTINVNGTVITVKV